MACSSTPICSFLLADAILKVILQDSLVIETGDLPHLQSLPDMAQQYTDQTEIEREPPDRIKVSCGGRLVAVEETEPWMAVGGPAPCHDSFTMSSYTAEDGADEFRRICESVAQQKGVMVTAFHEAERKLGSGLLVSWEIMQQP